MTVLQKIFQLSNKLAGSFLQNKEPKVLQDSELFTTQQKKHILDDLTNPTKIQERKKLLSQIDKKADWKKIQKNTQTPVYYFNYVKYAAVVVLLFGLGFYFINNQRSNIENEVAPVVSTTIIKPGSDKATLVLGSGKTIVLGQGNNYNANGVTANDKNIAYTDNDSKVEYNYLTIPRGGQFQLKLADGTKVWLNSQSQLKFPNHFVEGKTREVELVYGEAYFEVSPSSLHDGARFKVLNRKQEIEVIGTEFNVKAYKDEHKIYTTLVKGKITLKTGSDVFALVPDKLAVLDLHSDKVEIFPVDVYNYISWKEGVFSFESKPMKDIMIVLSRWYNVDVSFDNVELEQARFNGVLRKDQNIQSVLENMKRFGAIREYKIKNQKVELK